MTQAERDWLVALKKAKKRLITQKEAALELGGGETTRSRSLFVDRRRQDEPKPPRISNRWVYGRVLWHSVGRPTYVRAFACMLRADATLTTGWAFFVRVPERFQFPPR
jgi:hypothetical protein